MSKNNFNRSLAVIIGINDYVNDIRELKTAVPDAQKLASIIQKQHEYLKPQYQAQNRYEVKLILNENANLSHLKQLIADFRQEQILLDNEKVTVTKDDRVLFYFAGHGIALDALDNQEGPVGYIIPQDATLGDSSTYLPMQELHNALNGLPCRHMLVILDCCFAGAFRWASLKRQIVPKVKVYKERYDRFISDTAWQVITSASDDQKALDSLESRGTVKDGNEDHSPFATALFNVLRGEAGDWNKDCIITATEIYSYLRDQVEIESEELFQRQTPSLCPLRKHGKGEFIFLAAEFDRDKLEDAPPLDEKSNPYRGLLPYDENDSDLFFGREEQIKDLLQKVVTNNQPLTLLLGASGTGKSSLMKAGLIPRLRTSYEHQFQILDPMRPGESPLKALVQILLPIENTITAASFSKDEQALANIIDRWSQKNPETKLLLAVDQFEELITLSKSDEEREQFQKLIKNAITKYPNNIHVVITLRLDFEAQFKTGGLKNFCNKDTRFVVSPMSQNQFREVIEKPALEKVIYFEPPSLVDDLINEVVQMPGALPLLSFTLSELYMKYLGDRTRTNRALTEEDYNELGGVAGSLTKRANQEYNKLVEKDSAYKDTVQRVMLRMISLQGGLARRQVPKSEFTYLKQEENARVETVIKSFSEARLIVESSNSQDEPCVEPADDVLVREWDKLLVWKKEELENLVLQKRLIPAANDWKKGTGNLWNEEEGRLLRLKPVINSKQNWLNKVETDFVNKSIEEKRKTLRENEQQRDEALQGQISALAALSEARFPDDELGAMIHILKAGRILQQLKDSKSEWLQQEIDLSTEVILRQTLSKIKEFNRLEDKDVPLSMVTKLDFTSNKSTFILDRQGRGVTLNSIFSQELILTQNSRGIFRYWQLDGNLVPHIQPDFSLVKSSIDRQTIAYFIHKSSQLQEQPKQNAIRLLSLEGKEVIFQENENETLMTFALSPDGKLIAFGGWYGALYIWTTDGKKVEQKQLQGSLNSIDFSSNSEILATGGNDGKIRLWSQNGDLLQTVEAHKDAIWQVSFSPDGETLVSGSTDTTVKIWKTDGTLLTTINDHKDTVRAVCFNWDGQILASASDDGDVRLWRSNGTKLKCLDEHHTGAVYTVRFNPKQPMIATTSGQGQLILWHQDGRLLRTCNKAHNGTITALDFSPNGKMFVTAAGDREVKLWRLDDIDKKDFRPHNLGNHTGEINLPTGFAVSFSSDNQSILLGAEI